MTTYDPNAALASIDANVAWVLGFFAIAAIATFINLTTAFRMARAHEAFPLALPSVGWFAMHDLHFVLLYDLWFEVYDHWWVKAWWFALVFTTLIEFALVWMIIKHGRRELAPWATQRQFAALIVLATLAIGIIWLLVKASMDDPLFLISFPITAFWALPFSTALMLRRNSTRGQSVMLPISNLFIVGAFLGALWFVDPFFRTWPFVLFMAMGVCWALANVWMMRHLPRYESSPASA